MLSLGRVALKSGGLFRAGRSRSVIRPYSTPSGGKSTSIFKHRFLPALGFGLASGLAVGFYMNYKKKQAKIGLDAIPSSAPVDLQPPTKAAPFPATISINKEIFQALGTGVRTVTLLNFHVYAVGLYIAADDVRAARKVLAGLRPKMNPSNDTKVWENLLMDPENGSEVINKLLGENIRFAVRIVPVRNTDFGHMRDGFVRSVMNHPDFKSVQSVEVGEGINEIKRAFGRKLKLKSGQVVTWSRDINGGMSAWLGDSDEEKELLGSVSHPDVARLFFLQYTAVSKPNSPTLKSSAAKGLATLLS